MNNGKNFSPVDYLELIETNYVSQLFPVNLERYEYEVIDDEDYIVGTGRNINLDTDIWDTKTHADLDMLIDMLNIAIFYNSYIAKDFDKLIGIGYFADRRLPIFKDLISKVLDFSFKHGVWDDNGIGFRLAFPDNMLPVELQSGNRRIKQLVFMLVNNARSLLEFYLKFEQGKESFDRSELFDMRLSKLFAVIRVSLVQNINNESFLSYDVDNLFDLARYQLLIASVLKGIKVKLCPYCNYYFEAVGRQIFCSQSHKNSYYKDKPHAEIKLCDNCGTEFKAKNQREKYCSPKCKRATEYKRKKEAMPK